MKKLLLFSLFTLLASAMGWAATETWVKVDSQDGLTDGNYLIVYEAGSVAFDGSLTELDAVNNTTPVTISSDGTITTNNCDFYFTIASKDGGFSIKSKSELYIGNTKTGKSLNGLASGYTDSYTNTLSVTEGVATITSTKNGTILKYNANSDQKRFRYYSSGQQPIALYKKQEGSAPQPTPSQVAALEIKPGFGTIEVGTVVTISCATEGAVLNGTVGTVDLKGEKLPYTYKASEVGELKVAVKATKVGLVDSEPLSGTFIVKAAVPVAYRDVIVYTDEKIFTPTTSYKTFKFSKGGAAYIVTSAITTGIQLNASKAQDKGFPGLVMTVSKTSPSKIIITWNGQTASGRTLQIYGKNVPYSATSELYDSNKGNLIETVKYDASLTTTVELDGAYTYIGIVPSGSKAMYIDSFEFIWNEGAAGGADVTYTKASEAKAGNFAVLATADGKAVGRNADLSPVNVNVTVSGDAIGLAKGQTAIDEFEIKENGNNYQLYGGLASNGSRRYLTYDATGVTTVATADDNANVTFESKTAAGLLVKFNDGQYLMFNGTNFVKGKYTEVATQAEGETLTPVIVFMSSSNVSTGVETVEFDENAEAQYFNLNGVQVKAENLTPGLYIVRQGNKVSKQVIR